MLCPRDRVTPVAMSLARLPIVSAMLLREACRSLLRHKLRSALTMLGATIGVASVTLVVGVGEAGSRRAQAELNALGDNLVWVEAGSRNINGVRNGSHGTTTLTVDDGEAIRREVPLITRVSPQVDGGVQIISATSNWTTRFRGESPEYMKIKGWTLARGQPFSDDDVNQFASKILIGKTVREQLFGNADPVGKIVRIQGQLFEVAGELTAKGQNGDGRDQDDWILLPYTTALTKLRDRKITWLDDILCSADSADDVQPAIDRIVELLRQRHHIEPGQEDDFNIRRPDEVLKAQLAAADALKMFLGCIAAISLLVGGIGIMNVMLASVTQRTREIGLRLAIGARTFDVRAQFLSEAITLSVLGGATGVLLSFAGAMAFELVLGWPIKLSFESVTLALGAAVAVGI
jgi:putative ABC transport system permease protein